MNGTEPMKLAGLRDQFALAAMPHVNWMPETFKAAAYYCYQIADEMMEAREKPPTASKV